MFEEISTGIQEEIAEEKRTAYLKSQQDEMLEETSRAQDKVNDDSLKALDEIANKIDVPDILGEFTAALRPKHDVRESVEEFSWKPDPSAMSITKAIAVYKLKPGKYTEVRAAKLWSVAFKSGELVLPKLAIVLYQRQSDIHVEAPRVAVVEDSSVPIRSKDDPQTLGRMIAHQQGQRIGETLSVTSLLTEESNYSQEYKKLTEERSNLPTMTKNELNAYNKKLASFSRKLTELRLIRSDRYRYLSSRSYYDRSYAEESYTEELNDSYYERMTYEYDTLTHSMRSWETEEESKRRQIRERLVKLRKVKEAQLEEAKMTMKTREQAYVLTQSVRQQLVTMDNIDPDTLADGVYESGLNLQAINDLCRPPQRVLGKARGGGVVGRGSQALDVSSPAQVEFTRNAIGRTIEEQLLPHLKLKKRTI